MMLYDPSNTLLSGKPDLWPLEFWQVIIQLAERAKGTPQPRISLTSTNTPIYISPIGDINYEFNLALSTLEKLGIIEIRWVAEPGSQAGWIRLRLGKIDELETIIENYAPLQSRSRVKSQELDWGLVQEALHRYSKLGLRTVAHIAFGSSHGLDTISIPFEFEKNIWVQPDAIPIGADVIRVGGQIEFSSSSGKFTERWSRPGHYIWAWDVEDLIIESIGQKLLLIENPYPYWELLAQLKGLPISLVCLHGETRHHDASNSALGTFLGRIYQKHPNLETYIWCDPDPGGIFIANNAFHLVKKLGGSAKFVKMGEEVFDELADVLLSGKSGQPISQIEKDWLKRTDIHPDLLPLVKRMLEKEIKDEQEALVVTRFFEAISS